MTLSIILPTFNCEKVIQRCLESIVSQVFQDWELLVIDGVSTDGTLGIVRQYSSQDARIQVFSEPDKGIYDAMNKGIDKSHGRWLYFIGSDDYLYDTHSLEGIFSNNVEEYDVVYGTVNAPHWDECDKGEWKKGNYYWHNRCHQAIFYKRSFFGKRVRYKTRYKVLADCEMNLRWYLSPKYSSKYYPVVVANFTDGGYSSYTIDPVYQKEKPGLVLKYGHKVLPIIEKKQLAWWYMIENPEKKLNNFLLKLYVLYLRLIAKIRALFSLPVS